MPHRNGPNSGAALTSLFSTSAVAQRWLSPASWAALAGPCQRDLFHRLSESVRLAPTGGPRFLIHNRIQQERQPGAIVLLEQGIHAGLRHAGHGSPVVPCPTQHTPIP